MARKPSVIMSASERKNAKNDLKVEIQTVKTTLREEKQALKDLQSETKAQQKVVDGHAKTLLGLETRAAALSPPKPVAA